MEQLATTDVMTDQAPAAPLYDAVVQALTEQGKSKRWLHQQTGVARNTLDRWRVQPRAPQAAKVIAVADALGMDRGEALRLGGVLSDTTVLHEGEAVDLADLDTDVLLAEIRRRIVG